MSDWRLGEVLGLDVKDLGDGEVRTGIVTTASGIGREGAEHVWEVSHHNHDNSQLNCPLRGTGRRQHPIKHIAEPART